MTSGAVSLGVRWIYVKDFPNAALRHTRFEHKENKPVTNSRDTQEVLKIMHTYKHATFIFGDFSHCRVRRGW